MSLKHKILLGYLVFAVFIVSTVAVLLHERKRLGEIEIETKEIRTIRGKINNVHRCITELSTRGETVITWNEDNYMQYRDLRLHIDSLLLSMKQHCNGFVSSEQIDTLRDMLRYKESHLQHIMKTIHRQNMTDSLLIERLRFIVKAGTSKMLKSDGHEVKPDARKTISVSVPSVKDLHELNKMVSSVQTEYGHHIYIYVDSLRMQNEELNRKLYNFITRLDGQAQNAFKSREQKITEAQEFSLWTFSIVIIVAIIFLFVSFLIIRHDIEKEKRQKDKLQQIIEENKELLDMRKKIILTVSHDVRGPLGNINNCAELASSTREKKKRESYLENIRHSCRHILHLVNDLMDAYRLNDTRELNSVPFYLDSFLQRISDNFLRKANSHALIFKTRHRNVRVAVKGDPDKIEQVLTNLLTNAIKFTPSGSIYFKSEYKGGNLCVEICDTGIGMDGETLNRVFSPFERAAQNVNSEGFGLGLFITKGLVEALSGNMHVDSEAGKGSVFQVVIPLPETHEAVKEEAAPEHQLPVLPKKVLVVDDDPILLKVTEDMLGRNGVICTTCVNVRNAVEALYKSDYDLVLTDIQMPVTDGFGLLELFRNSDIGNSRTVPVAAMTAREDGNLGIYEQYGFCGCIHKPFEMKGLLAFLSAMIVKNGYSEFDFSRLLENTEDRQDMLSLVIKESEKDLMELEGALEGVDRKLMREIVHRMMPVWEMLGKEKVLYEFQDVLHDAKAEEKCVRETATQVIEWIKKLISETEKKMNRNENIDS